MTSELAAVFELALPTEPTYAGAPRVGAGAREKTIPIAASVLATRTMLQSGTGPRTKEMPLIH
jgi:hypothetical protein